MLPIQTDAENISQRMLKFQPIRIVLNVFTVFQSEITRFLIGFQLIYIIVDFIKSGVRHMQ